MNNYNHNQNRLPPRIAVRFLEWFCAPYLLKEVEGDLHELYGKRVKKYEKNKAQ